MGKLMNIVPFILIMIGFVLLFIRKVIFSNRVTKGAFEGGLSALKTYKYTSQAIDYTSDHAKKCMMLALEYQDNRVVEAFNKKHGNKTKDVVTIDVVNTSGPVKV